MANKEEKQTALDCYLKAQKEMEKLMKEYKNKDLDWDAVKRSYRIWTK